MKLGVTGVLEGTPAPAESKPKRPNYDHFNLYAIKRGAPAGWQWTELKAIGDVYEKDRARQYSQMDGYVHNGAKYATGKNAGKRKPRSPVPGTERTIIFTMGEFDAFVREWEIETGICSKCDGTGEEWASSSITEGSKYKPCRRCFATGKAHP